MKITSREQQLRRYQWLKLLVFLGFLTGIFLILVKIDNMLLSTLLAFVIAYLIGPLVDALERTGLDRLYAIAILFLGLTILFIVGVEATLPFVSAQIASLRLELPKYIDGTTALIQSIESTAEQALGTMYTLNLGSRVETLLTAWANTLFEGLPAILSQSLTVIMLAPFFAFFLLKDGRKISRSVLALVPNNFFELTLNLHNQINLQMAQFVRARLLEALIVGFVVLIGLWLIDFPYATLLAGFAALTNLIPYIGPVIGAVPAVIIALINGLSGLTLALMVTIYLIAQIIDIVIIIPLVVAKIVNLHPVTVIVALMVGSETMGIVGMIISIPVASALKVTFTSLYEHLIQFRA